MVRQLTWLSDTEWLRIEPLLPRGRKNAHRRVISGGAAQGSGDA